MLRGEMEPNLVTTVPVDGVAPIGARPSAGTVLTTKLDVSNQWI